MIKLLIILLISHNAWSLRDQIDLSYGAQGRTLPALGAEVFAETGLNQILWGEKNGPKDFLFGFVRPSIGASSSAVINSIKAEIEIFPISFLGFSLGRQYSHSSYDFSFFDCEKISCQGEFRRNFVESKMALSHLGWVLLANYKIDKLNAPKTSLPMGDWKNVIIGNPNHDLQIEHKLLLGKVLADKLVALLYENVHFEGSGQRKESLTSVVQFKKGETSYFLGLGAFHSDEQPMGIQIYLRMNHTVLPSLKVF